MNKNRSQNKKQSWNRNRPPVVNQSLSESRSRGSGNSKKPLFWFKATAVLIPLLFIVLAEILLRIAGYGDRLSLFVQHPVEGYEAYMMVNPEIGKKYFQKLEYTSPANDIFLKDKPAGTFRVFVMGSSVVYGFPYDRNLMFSRILHQQLADAYPDMRFELVNTSITAINSFTHRDFIGQIMAHDPDAILVYAGHNEFYGAFGIGSNEAMSRYSGLVRAHLRMMDLRFYQLLRNMITGAAEKLAGRRAERSQGTLMKRIVADQDILLHSKAYNITMQRYRQNMGQLLNRAQKGGVPVLISEVVSNIQGMEPFHSIATDTLEAAIDVFRQAVKADEQQHYETSRALYTRAKDLDCLRFRASEDINAIVHELADRFGAYKVPMLSYFQGHSPHGLIGNSLMTEHVHPNIDGAFIMADAFFDAMGATGMLGEQTGRVYSIAYRRRNWGHTALDSLLAYHRIQLLMQHWPFVKDDPGSGRYAATYQPKNHVDSIAFRVMRDPDVSLPDVRLDLAQRYERAGQTALAYREYEALLRMNPYIAVNFRDAANCLLQLGDLPLALDYLLQSLELENSFFALFRIGEIYLIMGDFRQSAAYFERARRMADANQRVSILSKLYAAYVYAGEQDHARAVADDLQRSGGDQHLDIPEKVYVFDAYVPFQTSRYINQAKFLVGQGQQEQALAVLESSLHVYDSHIANRMIGDILFEQGDYERARVYYQKVFDLFRFDNRFIERMTAISQALTCHINDK